MDKSQNDVESRFNGVKVATSPEDWLSVDYLLKKVNELEKTDLELAYRLMQRVKNISPTEEMIARLGQLKLKVQRVKPEALKTVSSKSTTKRKKTNVQKYITSITQTFENPKFKSLLTPFNLIITLPFLIFSFYQIFVATDRYESRVQVIVKSPDSVSTLDPTLAMLSGLGGTSTTGDNELLKAYIYSMDLVNYLENTLNLKEHYSNDDVDFISRLSANSSKEDFLAYFKKRVIVENDDVSGVLTINVQGFSPIYTQKIAQAIAERSENYINTISNNLAKSQLTFVLNEHEMTEQRLQKAKTKILTFQRQYNLLDPEAEGMALQKITYDLEGQIAVKRAEIRTLRSAMSENAPQVMQVRAQLNSLKEQLEVERERLTSEERSANGEENKGVGEILSEFSKLKIELEFALQAYASSQVSLEKSRVEAYRQIKYLIMVESPILPEDAKYPSVLYNLMLFLAATLMMYGIGRIIVATVNELR